MGVRSDRASNPHALVVIDKDGSILIHGISNLEAASLIAKEILLRIGLSEKVSLESGEVWPASP